jgi:hypothetical protein
MTDTIRIEGKPQLPSDLASSRTLVAASPGNYGSTPAAPNADAAGLLEGLSAFNPALKQFHQQALMDKAQADELLRQQQSEQFELQKKLAGEQGAAAAERVTDVRGALGSPVSVPDGLPLAFASNFRENFAVGLAHRAGVQLKTDAMRQYGDLRNTQDFDANSWFAQQRQTWLAGVQDPLMVKTLGAHLDELGGEVAADAEKMRRERQDEARVTTASSIAGDTFTANMTGPQMMQAYPQYLARLKAFNFDPKQSAELLFDQMTAASQKLGGKPELFDVFDMKDPATGLRLIDMNPQDRQRAGGAARARDEGTRHADPGAGRAGRREDARRDPEGHRVRTPSR